MKKLPSLLVLSILMILAASTNIYSQSEKREAVDSAICLEFIGKFDGTIKDLSGVYTAQLIKDNKVIKEQTLSITVPFKFMMKRSMFYTVKLIKQGYISKTVSVSTVLPKKLELENPYIFTLETNLISQDLSGQFKDDDIDFPVALVSYGKKCDCFEYNHEYTAKLISSMYNNLLLGD